MSPGLCAWCGTAAPTTKLFTVDTCAGCLAGGKQHRVTQSLKRWARGPAKQGANRDDGNQRTGIE